jgi:hypothetical protein
MVRRSTNDEINEKLAPMQYIIVGDYEIESKETEFKHVPCGTVITAMYRNMIKRLKNPDNCCETCHDFKSRKKSIDKVKGLKNIETAEKENNLTCLNKEDYSGSACKLKWQCNICEDVRDSHITNKLYKDSGCANCSTSQSEIICRTILESVYPGYKFNSLRPDFLLYENGKNLELDCYNKDLSLALEYQGIQHEKYSKFHHGDDENNFIRQKQRDVFKKEKCEENKIKLITVSYTVRDKGILCLKKYIYDQTIDYVKTIKPDIIIDLEYLKEGTINTESIKEEKFTEQLNKYKKALADENYKLLTEHNSLLIKDKTLVMCPEGHHSLQTHDNFIHRTRRCRYCKTYRFKEEYMTDNMKLHNIPIIVTNITNTPRPPTSIVEYTCNGCDTSYETDLVNFSALYTEKEFCENECSITNDNMKEIVQDIFVRMLAVFTE